MDVALSTSGSQPQPNWSPVDPEEALASSPPSVYPVLLLLQSVGTADVPIVHANRRGQSELGR